MLNSFITVTKELSAPEWFMCLHVYIFLHRSKPCCDFKQFLVINEKHISANSISKISLKRWIVKQIWQLILGYFKQVADARPLHWTFNTVTAVIISCNYNTVHCIIYVSWCKKHMSSRLTPYFMQPHEQDQRTYRGIVGVHI